MIKAREYRSDNQIWTIQRNIDEDKQQKLNSICIGRHSTQANTNNVNKTSALLQTTGGKDERISFLCW